MKFSASVDGVVTGVRFYKGDASNGGEHVGHLWTIGGMLLGSATFDTATETPSGWQQANFSSPIAVTAGTTYVVSYLNPTGTYSATNFYFGPSGPGAAGVDNGPLHALSHIEAGGSPDGNLEGNGNGVFAAGSTFPATSFKATNYFVDVVFASTAQDPQVFSVNPAPGAADIPISVLPTATFSEALDGATVTTSTVMLLTAGNVAVPISSVSYSPNTFTITITPQQDLQPGQAYTVILKGGAAGPSITDSTGTPLPANYIWSFTTAR
jgi:hypothetical protein